MPLDVMLQELRSRNADAYAATGDPDVFRADCPVCSGHRTLRLVEMPGGFVKTHCRMGCARAVIGERLAAFELVEGARQACSPRQAASHHAIYQRVASALIAHAPAPVHRIPVACRRGRCE